jgi:hypothetical protein
MMMTIKQLEQAHALRQKITTTEACLAEYREAEEVIVAIPRHNSNNGQSMRSAATTLTAAEIGGPVVAALQARVDAMKKDLRDLGVEWTDEGENDVEDTPAVKITKITVRR